MILRKPTDGKSFFLSRSSISLILSFSCSVNQRRIIIGILAFLFPFLFQFLSPVIPVEGLLDGGILVGAIFVFAAQFLLSIFLAESFVAGYALVELIRKRSALT